MRLTFYVYIANIGSGLKYGLSLLKSDCVLTRSIIIV